MPDQPLNMEQRIETLASKKLIGIPLEMSLGNDRTRELFQRFMPQRGRVQNRVSSDFILMQNYGPGWTFTPNDLFTKWATVEVSTYADIPDGMESYTLMGGRYAVFIHIGPATNAPQVFQYIFGDWFPKSGFSVDRREHFEILPKNYNPVDPEAREEIWIPISA